jgi:hypothetical protein
MTEPRESGRRTGLRRTAQRDLKEQKGPAGEAAPQEGAAGDVHLPEEGGEAPQRKAPRKRRLEAPVLVIEPRAPDGGPAEAASPPASPLIPVDLASLDLFAHTMPRPAARESSGPSQDAAPAAGEVQAREDGGARPAGPPEQPTAAGGSPHAGSGSPQSRRTCPVCGQRLRKARCLEVGLLACLACKGVFLDARAVRRLGAVLPWMRHVERFLSSASRTVDPPAGGCGAAS